MNEVNVDAMDWRSPRLLDTKTVESFSLFVIAFTNAVQYFGIAKCMPTGYRVQPNFGDCTAWPVVDLLLPSSSPKTRL